MGFLTFTGHLYKYMGLIDVLLAPVFLLGIYFFARFWRNKYYSNDPLLYKYFGQGLTVRVIGSIAFGLVYQFYYKGGDTVSYFQWSSAFIDYLFAFPASAIRYLIYSPKEDYLGFYYYPMIQQKVAGAHYIFKFNTSESYFIKLSVIPTILGLDTYLGASLLFALLSFFGSWCMFLVFRDIRKDMTRQVAIACLFIPSIIFWGSGVMKDSLMLASVCFLTYGLYFGIIKRENIIRNVMLIALCGYLIIRIKGYIILPFIPAAAYWIFMTYNSRIRSSFLRIISAPIFFAIIAGVVVFGVSNIGTILGRYSIENLQNTANDFQSWHQVASEGGSGYKLGDENDFTTTGLLKKFPLAVNVTLFRPYIWEARNAVNLIAALESLVILFFTITTIFRTGIFKLPGKLINNPHIGFCIIFALIFSFSVGLTSYNFGALVRYKIPCIPFYVLALYMLQPVREEVTEAEEESEILQTAALS